MQQLLTLLLTVVWWGLWCGGRGAERRLPGVMNYCLSLGGVSATLSQETVSMPPSLLRQLDQPECGTECGAWGGLELAWYVCEVSLLRFPLFFFFFNLNLGHMGS